MQSASPSAAPEAEISAEAAAPLAAVPSAAAEALIAEARARARRRRWRTATAAVIAAAAVGGGLVVTGVFDGGRTTGGGPARPLPLAARTGEVTGYLDPCIGAVLPRDTPAFAAGTVTALRGRQTWQRTADGYQLRLPATAPAAREHVAKNQAFALNLAAGGYTLVARYDGGSVVNVIDVTVRAGRVVRQNFPDICK